MRGSAEWRLIVSGSFPVCFSGPSFVFNKMPSFVSALFPVRFFGSLFVFNNFPASFLKKAFFFSFSLLKQPHNVPSYVPEGPLSNIAAFAWYARKNRRAGEWANQRPATRKAVSRLPTVAPRLRVACTSRRKPPRAEMDHTRRAQQKD